MDKMSSLQVRIGKILCIFSLVLFISKIIPTLCIPVLFKNISIYMVIYNIRIITYSLLFLITFLYKGILSKIIQVSIIIIEAIISLNSQPTSSFFGLSLIISAILLSYVYGFFRSYKIIKLLLLILGTYFLFIYIPLKNESCKYLIAFKWELFISIFILCLWYLLKDFIEEIKVKEFEERQKIIKTMERSNEIAHDAIRLVEDYFNKYNKE